MGEMLEPDRSRNELSPCSRWVHNHCSSPPINNTHPEGLVEPTSHQPPHILLGWEAGGRDQSKEQEQGDRCRASPGRESSNLDRWDPGNCWPSGSRGEGRAGLDPWHSEPPGAVWHLPEVTALSSQPLHPRELSDLCRTLRKTSNIW